MMSAKKMMLSACFSHHGFVSIESFPPGERYDSRFFTETVLPGIEKSLSVAHPRIRAKGFHLHIDDAKLDNSESLLSKTDDMEFIRVLHPPYSPDLAQCDFCLFGYLKEK
jgi:hypothetical protein